MEGGRLGRRALAAAIALLALAGTARAEEEADGKDRRIRMLEDAVRELRQEVRTLKGEDAGEGRSELEEAMDGLIEAGGSGRDWTDRFTIGGYGEVHLNFGEGSTRDQLDYHRFVLYVGHRFNDWIELHSELEIEHAEVADGAGGELVFEQLYVEAELCDGLGLRAGRVLAPLGITNRKHEPPSFNGVERPLFDRVIVPTTWSVDGAGVFGDAGPGVSWELYLVAGLDGSGFDAVDGIRGGRLKERPSLNNPAVTGRVDWFPFVKEPIGRGQVLRLGASGWLGGPDNGNKGADPGTGGRLAIVSADFEYSIESFDFRGAAAYETIDGARDLGNGTASAIFGWYLEAAVHVWPQSWREGKLEDSDLVLFVRFDRADTQHRMPRGVAKDRRGDRREIVFGATFFVLPNLVLKLDYHLRDDGTDETLDDLLDLGFGWQF